MKPFARPAFQRGSLGYIRYYLVTSDKTTMLHFATFGVFPSGFSTVWLGITALLLLFLEKAQTEFLPSLCRVVCNRKSGSLLHLYLSGSLPPRFYHSKRYLRHLNDGSFAFNSSVHTIQSLDIQASDFALTLTLSTTPWKCSTSRRFTPFGHELRIAPVGKSAWTAFTDSPSILLLLWVTQPVGSLDLRSYS